MTEHVLALARTLPFHSIGGMQSIAWDLLSRFAQMGRRVSVLTTTVPGKQGPFNENGVQVIPVAGTRPERCDGAWWQGSSRAARNLIEHASPDVVFSISSAAAGLLPLRRTMAQVPFVFQAHGTSWGEVTSKWRTGQPVQMLKSLRNLYWLGKDLRLYPRFDALVLVGDVIEQQFNQAPLSWAAHSLPRVVIRNGVDTQVFRFSALDRSRYRAQWGWAATDAVFVFAARLHAQKGVHETVDAFRSLKQTLPDARLLVIGDGEERLACEQASTAMSGSVRFTGAVSRSMMPGLLSAGDVFVFPTLRQEGLPMNVLEALSVGLPVVTSNDMRHVLEPGLDVRYAAARDTAGLARTMYECVLKSQSLKARLPPHYSLDECAKRYLALFEQLRAGRQCSP